MYCGLVRFAAVASLLTLQLSCSTATSKGEQTPKRNPMPPVHLNHFFVVLSPEVFRSVRNSTFLRSAFSAFEERTTSSQNQTWSGLYYYGRNTYFEFLPVGSLDAQKQGDCSIAFGVDGIGESDAIARRLESEFETPVEPSIVYRGDDKIPWFRLLLPRRSVAVPWFETWVMEYHQDFLPRWNPKLPPAATSISREAILTRYKAVAVGTEFKQPHLFEDIESITIALPPEDRLKFNSWLKALGFSSASVGERTDFTGPDIKVTVVAATADRRGILEAGLKLSQPLQQTFQFGDQCKLLPTQGSRATWRFVRDEVLQNIR